MRKAALDKYYTPTPVIKSCMEILLPLIQRDWVMVEPSAGDGRFVDYAIAEGFHAKGYDLCPDNSKIIEQDFLTSSRDFFASEEAKLVFFGNPPFGKGCSLAIKFFNHAASFDPEFIAFIIPASFGKKLNLRSRLDQRYSLYQSIPIKENFERIDGITYDKISSLSCEFQIWFRKDRPDVCLPVPELYTVIRAKTAKVKVEREDGSFSNRELPVGNLDVDFTIITHGNKCGQIQDFNPDKDKSNVKQFVKVFCKNDVDKIKDKFNNTNYEYFRESAALVGSQSCLSTEEIILCVENTEDYKLKAWCSEINLKVEDKD